LVGKANKAPSKGGKEEERERGPKLEREAQQPKVDHKGPRGQILCLNKLSFTVCLLLLCISIFLMRSISLLWTTKELNFTRYHVLHIPAAN